MVDVSEDCYSPRVRGLDRHALTLVDNWCLNRINASVAAVRVSWLERDVLHGHRGMGRRERRWKGWLTIRDAAGQGWQLVKSEEQYNKAIHKL